MSSRIVPVYVPVDALRVLNAAWLMLPGGKARNATNGYDVRVGVAGSDGNTAWVATFDGRGQAIPASGRVRLVGPDLGKAIPASGMVVAEVTAYGAPSILHPLSIQAQIGSSVLVPSHRVGEAAMRDAVDALAEHASAVGSGDSIATTVLAEPGRYDRNASSSSHTASTQTIVAGGAYENGTVSVVLTKPTWATTGYVTVTVDTAHAGVGGFAGFYVSVWDGTANRGEQLVSASNISTNATSLSWAGTITATGTLYPRFKCATFNVDIIRQTISVSVTWN